MSATEITPLLHGSIESSSLRSTDSFTVSARDGETLSATSGDALEDESTGADRWRIAATFYGFLIVGATDGAYGVMIHYLRIYYQANYLTVSILLLSPVVGYTIAALANNGIHIRWGQRGIAILGPGLHVVAFLAVAMHPPYQVLVLVFVLAGLGSGLVDAGWNVWIGTMPDSSAIMGSLHSLYGVGAALAPVVANAVITKLGWEWYGFYYLMALASTVELFTSTVAFFSKTGEQYRQQHGITSELEPEILHDQTIPKNSLPDKKRSSPVVQALGDSSTWLISIIIFLYAGVEISLADWIMTLAIDLRNQTPFAGSMLTFAFWGGLTFGRVVVGFLIPVFGNRKGVITICLIITILSHLVFTLRSDLATSAVVVPLLGFSLGPLFPEAVILQTKLIDRSLHVAAVGFACALGSAGGCVFPFLVGVIANTYGIQMLLPVVMVMLLLCLTCWLLLPRPAEDDVDPIPG
ncbi:MFS transporter [Cadophora sp. MPI-SDFR-AT-0126]|nr:MFS transporter [Leotiomycetes sp. MPI-SDFR-AT-0126]